MAQRGDRRAEGSPGPRLSTITLDGSLLLGSGAPASPNAMQAAAAGRSAGPRRPSPARVYLDKGDAEETYLHTLRTHFVRNGTAEPAIPLGRSGSRKYSLSPFQPRPVPAPGSGLAAASAGGVGSLLEQQEVALWEEREHELLDAQEARLAQLEDTLHAREEKREAYMVHRLEATAADRLALLARARAGAAQRQKHLAATAAHAVRLGGGGGTGGRETGVAQPGRGAGGVSLPALPKAALKPLAPMSPTLAAAVGAARDDLSSFAALSQLEAGPLARALGAGGTQRPQPPGRRPSGMPSSWAERKGSAYSRQLDSVYASLQAMKETVGRTAHPLEPLPLARRAAPASPRPGGGQVAVGSAGNGQQLAQVADACTTSSGESLSALSTARGTEAGSRERLGLSLGREAGSVEAGQVARRPLRGVQGELVPADSWLLEVASTQGGCGVELAGSRPGSGGLGGASGEDELEEESDIEEALLLHRRAAASPALLAVRGPSGGSEALEGPAAEAETAAHVSGRGAASPLDVSPRGALPAAKQAEEEGDASAPEALAAGVTHTRPAAVALAAALAAPGMEPLEGECPSGSATSRLSAAQLEVRLQEAAAAQLASMAAAALDAVAAAAAGQQFSSQQGLGIAEDCPGCGGAAGQLGATSPHQSGQDRVQSAAGALVWTELAVAAATGEALQEGPAGGAAAAGLSAGAAAADERSAVSRRELAADLDGVMSRQDLAAEQEGVVSREELAAELEGVVMQQLAAGLVLDGIH